VDLTSSSSSTSLSGRKIPIAYSPEWMALQEHTKEVQQLHLKDLLLDEERTDSMIREHNGIYLDFSRQNMTDSTLQLLLNLAERAKLKSKMNAMFAGDHINATEDRAVLHTALRAPRESRVHVDGEDVIPGVWEVLDKIKDFSDKVRSGEWTGVSGKPIKNVVAIGIGGSYLGPAFVHTSLQFDEKCKEESTGRRLRFLANVDPVDVAKALHQLDPEETLVVVISKTFTTTETMLNARTVRTWLTTELAQLGYKPKDTVAKHMVAVSTNLKLVEEFGIDPENAFGFWDWVGGRYSVTSAVGILPLSLQYGFEKMNDFLSGAHDMDVHFREAPFENNLPVIMALISTWNSTFLGRSSLAILPYCQALAKFPAHMQQVAMESLGKQVSLDGDPLSFKAGEVYFGEPGTNGQHSFYQLIHQGRVVPAEFIGSIKSQQSVYLRGEEVSNHDELMCNFFAQADALATGKSSEELREEGVAPFYVPHKTFSGNRPSSSLLLPAVNPYTVGQLLALYEARVAAQGFIWGINAFDQWGVELGKVLATRVRHSMSEARTTNRPMDVTDGYNPSTRKMINRYLDGKTQQLYPEPRDVFPCDLIHSEGCPAPYEDSDDE
jgi:glucose-6-phosphate isomerase